MASDIIQMKWKRPDSVEYPKVWYRFKARDLNSDELVEYRIEDLSESKVEESFKHMRENYIIDEPITQALGGSNDKKHFEDYMCAWRSILVQKTPLVCFKEGSDDIIGLNWIFITHKGDEFMEKFYANCKSPITIALLDVVFLLYKEFNPFKKYGVDEYMTSFGLSVDKKYRGRKIGDHFLATRKVIAREFGFKFTHTIFSSDFSNQNADNVGFNTEVSIRYDDIIKNHPEFNLKDMKSTDITAKTLFF